MSFPRYPKYKPSGVEWLGEVPEHWATAALGFRFEVALGKMLDGNRVTGKYLAPYLRNADVQWGNIRTENLPEMDFDASDRDRFGLRLGDLLVCEGGEVGRCAIWREAHRVCFYQKAIHRLRPWDRGRDSADFMRWMLEAAVDRGCFAASESKSTIAHLPAETFKRMRFVFPSLPEQRAIAAFLDRETAKIDALVAEQERLIELLAEKRQAVISHAVTKGLDPHAPMKPSGVEWLDSIPVGWSALKFARCIHVVEGQVDPEDPRYSQLPLIAPNHVEAGTGRLLATESADDQGAESGKYPCRAGDVIYSKIRPALRKTCIAPEDALCSADMYPLRAHTGLTNPFLYWYLLGEHFSSFAILESQRVAMPKVNRESLKEALMLVPPADEQRAIATFLGHETTKIDALQAEAEQAVALLQERRSALISAAVTGQIDVRGAAAAAAS